MNDVQPATGDDSLPLPSEHYELIVAPVLQVAAKSAATRGDPELYNDMASMLALMALVRALGNCWLQHHPEATSTLQDTIHAAPAGACVMVLKRGELSPAQVSDCIWALKTASQQLVAAKVLGSEQHTAIQAWQPLTNGDRKTAVTILMRATKQLVAAIDAWERARDGGQ